MAVTGVLPVPPTEILPTQMTGSSADSGLASAVLRRPASIHKALSGNKAEDIRPFSVQNFGAIIISRQRIHYVFCLWRVSPQGVYD